MSFLKGAKYTIQVHRPVSASELNTTLRSYAKQREPLANAARILRTTERGLYSLSNLYTSTAGALKSMRRDINRFHTNEYSHGLAGSYRGQDIFVSEYTANSTLTNVGRARLVAGYKRYIQAIRSEARRIHTTTRRFHGVTIQLQGGVNTMPGVYVGLRGQMKKIKLKAKKAPKSSVRHIGVEIEFFCPHERSAVEDALLEANLENHVEVKGDGSIDPRNPDSEENCDCGHACGDSSCVNHARTCAIRDAETMHGHEICILAAETEYASVIRRVCSVLNALDAEVNKSCGLHVHLDVRERDQERVYNNLAIAYPVLASMVPEQRRTNTYCRGPVSTDLDEQLGEEDRYWAINPAAIETHSTIEVRLHSGTVNAVKINNWVRLLVKIADAKYINMPINSLVQLKRQVKLNARLVEYVNKRIEKFQGFVSSELDEAAA